jgi:two-component system, NarL family, nitrate/nitrite sensor histidine kinase NarX
MIQGAEYETIIKARAIHVDERAVKRRLKQLHSVQTRLGLIFIGFLLLVGSSVVATSAVVRTQTNDAAIINLAGRQRMLLQRMVWLSLIEPDGADLADTVNRFGDTLSALRYGGTAVDADGRSLTLAPAATAALQQQLATVEHTWLLFRQELEAGDRAVIMATTVLLSTQLDTAVSLFEAEARAKVTYLQWLQQLFLLVAVLLLTSGYLVTYRRIVQPLATLGKALSQFGEGQPVEPITLSNQDELGELARAFESMRAEVEAVRQSLASQVNQRTRELSSAFEFSQEIIQQLNVDDLVQSVTDRARCLLSGRSASLCLLAEDGQYLELVSSSDQPAEYIGLRQPVGRELTRSVIVDHQLVVTDTACAQCGFLSNQPAGHCVAAPLRVGEQTLGALCIMRDQEQPFDANEVRAFTLLANSAAVAVINARLAENGRRQAEEAAALSERQRLAAELHDNLAQTIGFLHLKADQMQENLARDQASLVSEELNQVKGALEKAYNQVRAALVGLHEPALAANDLQDKLETCLADFRQVTGLTVSLTLAAATLDGLPGLEQAQLWHIVREALTNVRRHAQAGHVSVQLSRQNGCVGLEISDDGRGFDPTAVTTDNHLGLKIMRARAERSGGQLTVTSIPGAGTKIIASLPVNGNCQE